MKKIIITSGSTVERIDPVRYITTSNAEEEKIYQLCRRLAEDKNNRIILISGKTHLTCPSNVERIDVTTSHEMNQTVLEHIKDADLFIHGATIPRFAPVKTVSHKIKKDSLQSPDGTLSLEFNENPDIVAEVKKAQPALEIDIIKQGHPVQYKIDESKNIAFFDSSAKKNSTLKSDLDSSCEHLHALITAGPTCEYFDDGSFITNDSSGKMGYAIAEALVKKGITVTLISGPTSLSCPPTVNRISVNTAEQMLNVTKSCFDNRSVDMFFGVAAVADFSPSSILEIEKGRYAVKLKKNPDIIASVSHYPFKHKPIIVGFAAETKNLDVYAQKKLIEKDMDAICANQVGHNLGFNVDNNAITIFYRDGTHTALPENKKNVLAAQLIEDVMSKMNKLSLKKRCDNFKIIAKG